MSQPIAVLLIAASVMSGLMIVAANAFTSPEEFILISYALCSVSIASYTIFFVGKYGAVSPFSALPAAFTYYIIWDAFEFYDQSSIFREFVTDDHWKAAALQICLSYTIFAAAMKIVDLSRSRKEVLPQIPNKEYRDRLSILDYAVVFPLGVIGALLYFPYALSAFTVGRNSASESGEVGPLLQSLFIFLLFALSVVSFSVRHVHSPGLKIAFWMFIVLTVVMYAMSGTRFLLLVAVSAVLFNFISPNYGWKKGGNSSTIFIAALVGIGMILATQYQNIIRNSGAGGQTEEFQINIRGEGLLFYSALLDALVETQGLDYGSNHVGLLFFPIPRTVWPEKPRYLENRIVRDTSWGAGFSDNHSGAFGIGALAFADFGMLGVVLIVPIYAFLAHALMLSSYKSTSGHTRSRIFGALIPGILMFGFRQVTTTFFLLASLGSIYLLYLFLSRIVEKRP